MGIRMKKATTALGLRRHLLNRVIYLAGAVCIGAGMPAGAAVITIGGTNGYGISVLNNTVPNPAFPNTSYTRYQQVYGAPAFNSITEPVAIHSLSFFAATEMCNFAGCWDVPEADRSIAAGNYTVRLSTTSAAVDGLATAFSSNYGSDVQVFFEGNLSDTLTITGTTPFIYDPSLGNLLLEIMVNDQIANDGALLRFQETIVQFNNPATRDQMSSRIGSGANAVSTGQPWTRSGGYKTAFDYTPVSATPVPEPGTWALAIMGIGLIGAAARRRKVLSASV